ncbi:PIN domain-containing protein [Archaeoglobus sp.]
MNKILLDTSYLLPLFGIDVELDGLKENFPNVLKKFEVYYSPISLIEVKFIVLRLLKDGINLLEDYRIGIDSILAEDLLKPTPPTNSEIEEVADRLLIDKGLKDYFDRMIYATAVVFKLALVTEDRKLTELASNCTLKPPVVYSWKNLQSKL